MSSDDDARRKAFNDALSAFRDNLHHCHGLPLDVTGALSWLATDKVRPEHQDDGSVLLIVDVSVRDFADQRGLGRDKVDRLFKNLRHNGWLRRIGTRGPHYLRTPAHTYSGRSIPRGFGFYKEIRTLTPWEDIAKRPEKRKDRAPSTRREHGVSEGHGHSLSEGHGQDVRGPRTPPSEGHGQSRPRATDTECPRATDTSSEGHGQAPALSPYKPSRDLEPQSHMALSPGVTPPAAATAGGHPVPHPPATWVPSDGEIPAGPDHLDGTPQPDVARAHEANASAQERDWTAGRRPPSMPQARDLLFGDGPKVVRSA